MKLTLHFTAACVAMLFAISAQVQAGAILQATSITSPQGDNVSIFALQNIINQSGLAPGYVSGVTDFDTYTATATHLSAGSLNSGFTASGPQTQFSFNLGGVVSVDGLAFWDVNNNGSVTSFDLYADTDQDYTNGGLTLIGNFNPTAFFSILPTPAQVFTFGAVSTQFLHINALAPAASFSGIGEVAFRLQDDTLPPPSAEIPEPTSVAIWSIGLMGMALGMRRRRSA